MGWGSVALRVCRNVVFHQRPLLFACSLSVSAEEIVTTPLSRIRNFSIVAHIDHGKSTLADRLLEKTGLLSAEGNNQQVMDGLQVERERGITVKAQTAAMPYFYNGELYVLNMVDTPGHVDFSHEVARSLRAVEGAVLLVDAAQGIQAQTVASYLLCMENDLDLLAVANKVDLARADVPALAAELEHSFDIPAAHVLPISAKTGMGVDGLLPALIENMLPPEGAPERPLRALVFDSWYDAHRGVVCLVRIVDGCARPGEKMWLKGVGASFKAIEVGIMQPHTVSTSMVGTGQVGYIVTGLRKEEMVLVGDTLCSVDDKEVVAMLPGFDQAKSMVYAGVYPMEAGEFEALEACVHKLALNDPSLMVSRESRLVVKKNGTSQQLHSDALGFGLKIGFLGLLHMSVFRQRLENEFDAHVVVTTPTVPYKVVFPDGTEQIVEQPSQFPGPEKKYSSFEPIVDASVVCPTEYVGSILALCTARRALTTEMFPLGKHRSVVRAKVPLAEVVTGMQDAVKAASKGFASFDYHPAGDVAVNLARLDILVNKERVDALSVIVPREKARGIAVKMVEHLKKTIPRQLFEVAVQGAIGSKILARANIRPLRKDVTAKCYGGDVSRKKKLLEAQKKGKARLRAIGQVRVPASAFTSLLDQE